MSSNLKNSDIRILVIDDLYGRSIPAGINQERENLCAQFLLEDITGDESSKLSRQRISNSKAKAVFFRGQTPASASIGDYIENDLAACINIVARGWTEIDRPIWSLVLLDLCFYTGYVTEESNSRNIGMPEGQNGDDEPSGYFGLQILETIQRKFPNLPVIIFSSMKRQEVSLEFVKKGALGFLERKNKLSPEYLDEFIWRHGLIPDDSGEIIGKSKPLLFALREARKLAPQRTNVLIRGERGTGKELMARYIYLQGISGNSRVPFVAVNSATFSSNLYASELFGIEPKTATDVSGKSGLIEQADNGDIFFDEVGDMPLEVQAGILRVLQERKIMKVGGNKLISVNVRFISATNKPLEYENYRPDLLDRLSEGGTIVMPPLRERKEDIQLLVKKLLYEAELLNKKATKRIITPEALNKLQSYNWPGNIRELRNVIFDAVNSYPDVEHLVPHHLKLSNIVSDKEIEVSTSVNNNLQLIISEMNSYSSNALNPLEWAGKFSELQSAYAHITADLVKAALIATKKRSPESPGGSILIHTAAKLLTGDSNLTASKAADLIKRVLTFSPEEKGKLLEEEILMSAYQKAKKLRPSSPKKV